MSVEAELWRIFTFYSLHSDSSTPDVWKITSFVKFAKDCQITSSKFTTSELELEIVRLVRNKRKHANKGKSLKSEFESTHTILITFPDFLRLLEIIAVRVYPAAPGMKAGSVPDPMVSLRRLLLENVLLLASRRSDYVEKVCAHKDEAAEQVAKDTFAKPLMGIFKYYIDLADKRRSQELAIEAIKQGVTRFGADNKQQDNIEQANSQHVREFLRQQKDLISFKEYSQFCHDFNLKSTNLLTALEVGEIFLNIVPINKDTKLLRGMAFNSFVDVIVSMAMLAYKSHVVDPARKVKALLHFMWKALNQTDKKAKAVLARTSAGGSHAGSLNQYGGGMFFDFFIRLWTKEGFPNYTVMDEAKPSTGTEVLKRILLGAFDGGDEKEAMNSPGDSEAKSDDASTKVIRVGLGSGKQPLVLHGFLLAALFRTRPEMSEMIYLELLGRKHDHDIL